MNFVAPMGKLNGLLTKFSEKPGGLKNRLLKTRGTKAMKTKRVRAKQPCPKCGCKDFEMGEVIMAGSVAVKLFNPDYTL